MSERAAAILGVCIIIAAFLLAWLPQLSTTGRYQIVCVDDSCLLLDTQTGQVWEKYISSSSGPGNWTDATGPWRE